MILATAVTLVSITGVQVTNGSLIATFLPGNHSSQTNEIATEIAAGQLINPSEGVYEGVITFTVECT